MSNTKFISKRKMTTTNTTVSVPSNNTNASNYTTATNRQLRLSVVVPSDVSPSAGEPFMYLRLKAILKQHVSYAQALMSAYDS